MVPIPITPSSQETGAWFFFALETTIITNVVKEDVPFFETQYKWSVESLIESLSSKLVRLNVSTLYDSVTNTLYISSKGFISSEPIKQLENGGSIELSQIRRVYNRCIAHHQSCTMDW